MMVNAAQALSRFLASRPRELAHVGDECSLVYAGVDFSDGDSITVQVTRLASDHYLISDAGLIADRLGDAGVDLAKRAARESWLLATRTEAPVLADVGPYDIARTSTLENLGESIWDVVTRCLQADGLRVIGKHHRLTSFMEQAIHAVAQAGIAVKPRATLRNKFGGARKVHFLAQRVSSPVAMVSPQRVEGVPYFVMTANSPGSFMDSHDSVLNAFRGADVVRDRRIALLGPQAKPEEWHRQSLLEECRVEQVNDVDEFVGVLVSS